MHFHTVWHSFRKDIEVKAVSMFKVGSVLIYIIITGILEPFSKGSKSHKKTYCWENSTMMKHYFCNSASGMKVELVLLAAELILNSRTRALNGYMWKTALRVPQKSMGLPVPTTMPNYLSLRCFLLSKRCQRIFQSQKRIF